MADTPLTVSVIICVYTEKRWNDIVDAVASVQQQSTPPYEIIIVVDHNPALLERVRMHLPGVIAVENSEIQGLSGARNSGIAVAQGALVAFLDDDATAEPDWLALLSRCCEDPEVMGTGGTVEPEWLSEKPLWFPEEFNWVLGCSYQHRPQHPVVVRNPFGGCTCYRRDMFDTIGGFRTDIGRIGNRPLGCEETELCIRAKQHWPQKVFLYEPKARIHHRIPATRTTWRYFRSRCYAEGLSKAMVAQYVGAKDGLSSERSYIVSNLVSGVTHGLMDLLLRFDVNGLSRIMAIIIGLTVTVAGYLVGSMTLRFSRKTVAAQKNVTPAQPIKKQVLDVDAMDVPPVRMLEVDISQPLISIAPSKGENGRSYQRAFCLVRLHTQPLGLLELSLSDDVVSASDLAKRIWNALGTEINEHLKQDGLPELEGLDAEGLPGVAPCIEKRESFLVDAPFVSVIVPTHERLDTLEDCLHALLSVDYPRYEVVVVDNAPRTDATAKFIKKTYGDDAQVRYVCEKRAGVSLARNRGIEEARGELLVFVDDDAIVDRYWLVEMVRAFGRAKNVGCVTSLVLPIELETPAQILFEGHLEQGGYASNWRFVRRIFANKKHRYMHLYRIALFGAGVSMAFKADLLRRIGGFDPALGTKGLVESGEDIAAFFQLFLLGYSVVHEPTALVYHHNRREYAALRKQIYSYGVGATAYLTKNLLEHPGLLIDLLVKVPFALLAGRRVRVQEVQEEPGAYVKDLSIASRKGLLRGPFLYLWGRLLTRGQRKALPVPEVYTAPLVKKES